MIFRKLFLFALLATAHYAVHPQQQVHVSPIITEQGSDKVTTLSGKVVGISDGDTFKLLLPDSTTVKIRIASIDCPERKQPFSAKAKQFTSEQIFEKQIKVAIQSKDRYGRYIAKVLYANKDLGEELLRYGMAWHFVRYSSDEHLQKLEDAARAGKIGLWADKKPIPPWDWRKGIRTSR